MAISEKYYLSSLESYELEEPRECVFMKKVLIDSKKEAIVANISPPLNGQRYGLSNDVSEIVITHRHEGYGLFPIIKFPCFVFVTIPLADEILEFESLASSQLRIIAWAELYRTISDAKNHVFDPE